jgi:hypothetical protein
MTPRKLKLPQPIVHNVKSNRVSSLSHSDERLRRNNGELMIKYGSIVARTAGIEGAMLPNDKALVRLLSPYLRLLDTKGCQPLDPDRREGFVIFTDQGHRWACRSDSTACCNSPWLKVSVIEYPRELLNTYLVSLLRHLTSTQNGLTPRST